MKFSDENKLVTDGWTPLYRDARKKKELAICYQFQSLLFLLAFESGRKAKKSQITLSCPVFSAVRNEPCMKMKARKELLERKIILSWKQ